MSWFSLRGISERKHEISRDGRLPRQPLSRRKRRTNLHLEPLEDRIAPATLTVTTLADESTTDGQVSLREAIQAAETHKSVDGSATGTGNDTIVFAPSIAGGVVRLTQADATLFGP